MANSMSVSYGFVVTAKSGTVYVYVGLNGKPTFSNFSYQDTSTDVQKVLYDCKPQSILLFNYNFL